MVSPYPNSTQEVQPLNRKNERKAARMLDQAVRIAIRSAESGMLGSVDGRLAADLRKSILKLKRLAVQDPDHVFWEELQKAITKLLRYLQRMRL